MPRIVDEAIDYLTERDHYVPPVVAVLAFLGLGRLARTTALALLTLWLADQMRIIDGDRAQLQSKHKREQIMDEAVAESFPASDPPSYSPVMPGVPAEVSNTARLRTVR